MTTNSEQSAVFNFLSDPATHHLISPVRRFDTHGACVFLAGDHAYKIKRAVSFPYMDFSTIEKRKIACENEIAVNHGNAPELYIGVVPITRDTAGLRIGGKGQVVEWTVHMRRFDEEQTLDRLADKKKLNAGIIDQLAKVISVAHEKAPVKIGASAVVAIRDVIVETLQELDEARDEIPAEIVDLVRSGMLEAHSRYESLLVRRSLNGKVRHCHGDLHLGNIVLQAGKPVLFDAIEFSDSLATIDILYDLAFLIMDLCERGFSEFACRLLNRYLWLSEDEAGEIEGVALLPLFLALRATIRAKVSVAQARLNPASPREQIQGYMHTASLFITPPPPRLIAIGGLSGTGKTRLADTLSFKIGAAPGSLHLRSDIERKKAFGVAARTRLPATAYSPTASEGVYRRLRALAEAGLRSGRTVILDATFRDPNERHALEDLAARANVTFSGLWLEAPPTIRISRVCNRIGDASDATPGLVNDQDEDDTGTIDWPKVDASQTIGSVSNSALALLSLPKSDADAQQ